MQAADHERLVITVDAEAVAASKPREDSTAHGSACAPADEVTMVPLALAHTRGCNMAKLDVSGAFIITIGKGSGPETVVAISANYEDGKPFNFPREPDRMPVRI